MARAALPSALLAAALVLLVAASSAGQCEWNRTLVHESGGGAFDFAGTEYDNQASLCRDSGPPFRFWELDNFAGANSWQADLYPHCHETFQNALLDLGLPGALQGQWVSVSAGFAAPRVMGCPAAAPQTSRVVVETSFVDSAREGTAAHRGFYAIASVEGCNTYDLDQVLDGDGPAGRIVPVREIDAIESVLSTAIVGMEWFEVLFKLRDLRSFGDAGRPDLVEGIRILYETRQEPTSSDPSTYYGEVLRPFASDEQDVLGVIPLGTEYVEACVRLGSTGDWVWFSALPVYRDATSDVAALAASAHRAVPVSAIPESPWLAIEKSFTPERVKPGGTVTLAITVTHAPTSMWDAQAVEVRDHIGPPNMPAGCVLPASGRNLQCPACDQVSYDPATGDLYAFRAALGLIPVPETLLITMDFDAGPADMQGCANTAAARAFALPPVTASATFEILDDTNALLRDDSIRALVPRPDLEGIFPLPVYMRPGPALPFTDEPNLLTDPSRPLVFYQVTYPSTTVIRLVANRTPGTMSITLDD